MLSVGFYSGLTKDSYCARSLPMLSAFSRENLRPMLPIVGNWRAQLMEPGATHDSVNCAEGADPSLFCFRYILNQCASAALIA